MTRATRRHCDWRSASAWPSFVAYGLALPVPFVVCVMAVLVLSKPGPPLPLVKAARRRAACSPRWSLPAC